MAPLEQRKGPRCNIEGCRSRRYHIADDGLTYCQNGHQQSELGYIFGDDDYTTPAARRARRQSEAEAAARPKYFSGREATELYLQCFQLVLRKQVWWLVTDEGYPTEVEAVVRDLWALRAGMCKGIEDDESESVFDSSRNRARSGSFLSVASSDVASEDADAAPRVLKKRLTLPSALPRLPSSLSLIYVALLLLRLPVSVADLRTWIFSPGFPYLRAIDTIPLAMKQNLDPRSLRTFMARTGAPGAPKLHYETLDMIAMLQSQVGMSMPGLNAVLLLNRHMKTLGMPLDVFALTRRLAKVLDIKFSWPESSTRCLILPLHPEVQVIALVTIAVKLLYPFDNVVRHPFTDREPATLTLFWEEWARLRHANEQQCRSKAAEHEKMLATTEIDVLQMNGEQMDHYLQWSGGTWLSKDEDEDVRPDAFFQALFEMFPLPEGRSTATDDSAGEARSDETSAETTSFPQMITASLEPIPAKQVNRAESPKAPRPGYRYQKHKSAEDVPELANAFLQAAAKTVELDLESLLQVIHYWENRLQLRLVGGIAAVKHPRKVDETFKASEEGEIGSGEAMTSVDGSEEAAIDYERDAMDV